MEEWGTDESQLWIKNRYIKKNISSKIIQALKLLLGCDRAFVFCETESTTDYLKKVAGFHGIQAASKYILLDKLVRPVLNLLK